MMTPQAKQFRSTLFYIILLTQWLFALTFVAMIGGWENGLKYIYFSPEWDWPQVLAVVTTTVWLVHFPVMYLLRDYFFGSDRFQQIAIIGAYYITTVIAFGLVGNYAYVPVAFVIFAGMMIGLWYCAYPFQKRLTVILSTLTLILVGFAVYISLPDRYCWDQLAQNQVDQSISTAGNYQMVYVENCMKEFKSGPIARFVY
jgi:hypothetical protein